MQGPLRWRVVATLGLVTKWLSMRGLGWSARQNCGYDIREKTGDEEVEAVF